MPLSPHEEKALAALERGLRADDPAFAAVLGSTAGARPPLPLSTLHVVALVCALLGLVGVGTVFGHRPAVLALATGALLLPWLVGTARSVHRSRFGDVGRARVGRTARTRRWGPLPMGPGAVATGVALLLVLLAVTPPVVRAIIGLAVVFLAAPWLAVRVMLWMDRKNPG